MKGVVGKLSWSFMLILGLGVAGASAGAAEDLAKSSFAICRETQRASCQPIRLSSVQQIQKAKCELEMQEAGCEEAGRHLVDKSKLKNCELMAICESQGSTQEFMRTCIDNWAGAWKDALLSLLDVSQLFNGPSAAELKMLDRVKFLAECDSADCKRQMLGTYAKQFTEQDLQTSSAEALLKKLFADLRAKHPDGELPTPFKVPWEDRIITNVSPGHKPRTVSDFMKVKTDEILQKVGVSKAACYDPLVLMEMRCYAAFTILDPTLVAGGIYAKIGKTAGLSGKLAGRSLASEAKPSAGLQQFIDEMNQSPRAQNLNRAKNLTEPERLQAARGILRRPLTENQEQALIRAHKVGEGKDFGEYTQAELDQKKEILRAAGFSQRETELLRWKGIAGGRADGWVSGQFSTEIPGAASSLKDRVASSSRPYLDGEAALSKGNIGEAKAFYYEAAERTRGASQRTSNVNALDMYIRAGEIGEYGLRLPKDVKFMESQRTVIKQQIEKLRRERDDRNIGNKPGSSYYDHLERNYRLALEQLDAEIKALRQSP